MSLFLCLSYDWAVDWLMDVWMLQYRLGLSLHSCLACVYIPAPGLIKFINVCRWPWGYVFRFFFRGVFLERNREHISWYYNIHFKKYMEVYLSLLKAQVCSLIQYLFLKNVKDEKSHVHLIAANFTHGPDLW